jgi:hypothetical protein
MAINVKVHAAGLLNYAKEGKTAVQRIRKAMRTTLNVGRTHARQRINADFGTRTGFLRRQARKLQTSVTVRASEISGRVKPIPRRMNIFESGATLAHGRGTLRPRPVVAPAQTKMNASAIVELNKVMQQVGK